MRKDVAETWALELESGKFRQGLSYLRTGGENPQYCCLGVLCEMAVGAGVIPTPVPDMSGWNMTYGEKLESRTLPAEVMKWAGLQDRCGAIYQDDPDAYGGQIVTLCLTSLNDDAVPFTDIAQAIRENVEAL